MCLYKIIYIYISYSIVIKGFSLVSTLLKEINKNNNVFDINPYLPICFVLKSNGDTTILSA